MLQNTLPSLYGATKYPELMAIIEEKHKTYAQKSSMMNLLFNGINVSGTDIYQLATFSGVRGPESVAIGGEPAFDTIKDGFKTNVTFTRYGVGFEVAKQTEEDQVKLNLTKRAMDFFMKGHAEKREYILAGHFADAFTTALADGKVLCASDHPLEGVPGGTCSNLGTAASLTKTSLRALRNVSQNQLDEQANRVETSMQYLVVGQYHQDTVKELMVSDYDPENANNAINTLKAAFTLLPGGYWPHLSPTSKAFYVACSKEQNYFYHIQRDAYSVAYTYADHSKVHKYSTDERYGTAVASWRGVSGNAGA